MCLNETYGKVCIGKHLSDTFPILSVVEKTEYIFLSHHQYTGQNHNIRITNRSFENLSQFIYLGTTVTNQNLIWKLR
jgi:hypothetical protein